MYKLENVNVYNVSATASPSVKAQEGRKTTSAISFTPLIDTRDDYYNPTRGARHSLFIENAGGILGGDNSFVKVLGETSWFFPMPLKTVLNLRGKLGVIAPYSGVLIPIYEKFFVGGLYTVRGFEYGMAGPLDINGEPIGANKMVVFNSELTFPLVGQMGLKGALFFDIGKGFNRIKDITPLKFGIGPGIRWLSPFGPIHVDLGFNLNPKPGEKGHVFDFTAGTVY
jgi:outer membrane protein insertion porin family